jgi:hypothetical protein
MNYWIVVVDHLLWLDNLLFHDLMFIPNGSLVFFIFIK